jgi:hypothetical protein
MLQFQYYATDRISIKFSIAGKHEKLPGEFNFVWIGFM